MVTPICSGKLSVYPNIESCGFLIHGLFPGGVPLSFTINRKDTRLMFPDFTGFAGRLNNQDAAYRFLAAEGGEWRFCITKQMLCQIDVVTSNLEWLLRIILDEGGYFLSGFCPIDNVRLMRFDMLEFNVPDEMRGKKLVILPEGFQ